MSLAFLAMCSEKKKTGWEFLWTESGGARTWLALRRMATI